MPNRLSAKSATLAVSRFAPAGTATSSRSRSRMTAWASAPNRSHAFSIPFTPPSVPGEALAWDSASACPSFANMAGTSKRKFFTLADRPSLSTCPLHPLRSLGRLLLLRNRHLRPPVKFGRPRIFSQAARCSFSTMRKVSACFFRKACRLTACAWAARRRPRRLSPSSNVPAMTRFSATYIFLPAASL